MTTNKKMGTVLPMAKTHSSSSISTETNAVAPSGMYELLQLDTNVAAMACNADAALIRALELKKLISELRSVMETLDPLVKIELHTWLERCETALRDSSGVLIKATSGLRSEYRDLRPKLEKLMW